jgi:hypothetical protein
LLIFAFFFGLALLCRVVATDVIGASAEERVLRAAADASVGAYVSAVTGDNSRGDAEGGGDDDGG